MGIIWDASAGEDWELRPIEPEDSCDYCQALDTQPHQEDCPLFLPKCACGRPARRYVSGEPICNPCQRQRAASAALVATPQQRAS